MALASEWQEPAYPPIVWTDLGWVASIRLDAWPDAPTVLGTAGMPPYYAPDGDTIEVTVDSPAPEDQAPPDQAQSNAFRQVTDQAYAIRDVILAAVSEYYADSREDFLDDFDEDEAAILLPVLQTPHDLMPLIHLQSIRILAVQQDGIAYTGYSFTCTWDQEHMLGLMLHGDRVVKVGGADVPRLEWIAKHDAKAQQP